jgi:sugar/nucleoside kinase (ribokinase family)
MPRTMSIGGATYDLFIQANKDVVHGYVIEFPLGEKIRIKSIIETCGGGASNTAVGLSRLGCDTHFAGILSSDKWGKYMLKNFHKENVDTECVTIVDGECSSFSIIIFTGGDRVILYEPGTNAHLHDATFDRSKTATMDWIYLNHILEESCIIQNDIIDILINNDSACLTWNPGGCQFDIGIDDPHNATLLRHTDLLILNKEEAMRFTKKDNAMQAIMAISHAGAAIVCMTDGKNGVLATDGKMKYQCPAQNEVDVIDTTGAGDAFGIGATWALMRGLGMKDMLRAGTFNAASVVAHIGAQKGLMTENAMISELKEKELKIEIISSNP